MLRSKTLLGLVVIVVAGLACSMSGSNGLLDSNSLATVVVATSHAAAAQTADIIFMTGVPTVAPTQGIVTVTPVPITPLVSTEGTSLAKQGDGSYIFTDQLGGYSIVVPSVWLAMRINEQDYSNARISLANADPQIQRSLATLQDKDPKTFRLVGIDTSPSDLQSGQVSNLILDWNRDDKETIEVDIDQAKKAFANNSPPIKVTYADLGTTSTHIQMGVMEMSSKIPISSKQTATLYQKMVIFKVKSGTLAIMLSTSSQLKDKLVPGFDLMTDQIKLLP